MNTFGLMGALGCQEAWPATSRGKEELILGIVAAEFLRDRLVPSRLQVFLNSAGSGSQAHFQYVQQKLDQVSAKLEYTCNVNVYS